MYTQEERDAFNKRHLENASPAILYGHEMSQVHKSLSQIQHIQAAPGQWHDIREHLVSMIHSAARALTHCTTEAQRLTNDNGILPTIITDYVLMPTPRLPNEGTTHVPEEHVDMMNSGNFALRVLKTNVDGFNVKFVAPPHVIGLLPPDYVIQVTHEQVQAIQSGRVLSHSMGFTMAEDGAFASLKSHTAALAGVDLDLDNDAQDNDGDND